MTIFAAQNGNGNHQTVFLKLLQGDLTGPNPTTDRGKPGTKRHVLAYKKGIPLSVVITAANTHDMKAATETLDYIVTKRPHPKKKKQQ